MAEMNYKIKSPVTKGTAKVPVIMQLEALECGAASLAMIMAYYGKWVPLNRYVQTVVFPVMAQMLRISQSIHLSAS